MTAPHEAADVGVELLPCPFCGVRLRHIGSLARSFDPPRLYHEYHHDPDDCIMEGGHWYFSDTEHAGDDFAKFSEQWNRRATLTPRGEGD